MPVTNRRVFCIETVFILVVLPLAVHVLRS